MLRIESIKHNCGAIVCDNIWNFTIYCCFCNEQLYVLEEFRYHLQNQHSDIWKESEEEPGPGIEEINKDYVDDPDTSRRDEIVQSLNIKSTGSLQKPKKIINFESEDDAYEESVQENQDYNDQISIENCMSANEDNDDGGSFQGDELRNIEVILNDNFEYDLDVESIFEDEDCEHKSDLNSENDSNYSHYLSSCNEDTQTKTLYKGKKTCPECKEILPREVFIHKHVFEFHGGYKCSQCDKRYRLPHHRKRHEATHSDVRAYVCPFPECKRGFTYSQYLKDHLDTHKLERNFVCDFEGCTKAFPSLQKLKVHAYTHGASFLSKFCKNSSKISSNLYICDACGRICGSPAHLAIHQRIHTGEKPFDCPCCEKSFTTKANLKMHMASHSDERPFVCDICQAAFTKKPSLKRHRFIHFEEKNFKCKFCDKAFKQCHVLGSHVKNVHRKA